MNSLQIINFQSCTARCFFSIHSLNRRIPTQRSHFTAALWQLSGVFHSFPSAGLTALVHTFSRIIPGNEPSSAQGLQCELLDGFAKQWDSYKPSFCFPVPHMMPSVDVLRITLKVTWKNRCKRISESVDSCKNLSKIIHHFKHSCWG